MTRSVDPRVRPLLVCPRCRGELDDAPGWLVCSACAVRWPVVDGVPRLVPEHAVRGGVERAERRR